MLFFLKRKSRETSVEALCSFEKQITGPATAVRSNADVGKRMSDAHGAIYC